MRSFSFAFKETLFRFNLSGSELSEKSGLTPAQISQFKSGKNLRIDSVERLLEAMPVPARHYLLALVLSDEALPLPEPPQTVDFPSDYMSDNTENS
jgi:transcriptional regulator with XRE-family HTH domain